jgi:hypothetical protein
MTANNTTSIELNPSKTESYSKPEVDRVHLVDIVQGNSTTPSDDLTTGITNP